MNSRGQSPQVASGDKRCPGGGKQHESGGKGLPSGGRLRSIPKLREMADFLAFPNKGGAIDLGVIELSGHLDRKRWLKGCQTTAFLEAEQFSRLTTDHLARWPNFKFVLIRVHSRLNGFFSVF